MKKLTVLLILSFLAIRSFPAQHPDSDSLATIQQVKDRVLTYLLGEPGNGTFRKDAVAQLDKWVESVYSKGSEPLVWDDKAALTMNVKINDYASDLRRLAVAFRTKGSRYENDPMLKRMIIEGIEKVMKYFNPSCPQPGNWYQWLISLPSNMGSTALLMEPFLTEELLNDLRKTLRWELTDLMVLTGTNAAWESRNHIYLALLDGDLKRLKRAADYVFRTVRYGFDSGLCEDYCYLFHGRIPYAGGYGAGFLQTISEFIYVFDGTPFSISPLHREIVVNLLLEHTRWFLAAEQTDMHVRGRTFKTRGNWNSVLESALVLAQTDDPRKKELASTAMAMLKTTQKDLDLTSAGFADRIKAKIGELPIGFRYWTKGEIGVYNQASFHIGFRQFSSRIQDYEYLKREDGGEGEEGWNLAYGFTNILRKDGKGSWYEEGVLIPEIDMEHLPSATTRIGGSPVNPPFVPDPARPDKKSTTGFSLNFGRSHYAGGAGWEDGGVAGFLLEPAYGDFTAQKSLHFFPQGYWALGSGITSAAKSAEMAGKPIHTTLLQWTCSKDNPEIILPDSSVFPGKTPLTSLKKIQWFWIKDENAAVVFNERSNISVRLKNKIMTAWIDHGLQPSNAHYAYAVLPSVTLEEAKQFVAEMPFSPVRNDENVHAVRQRNGLAEGIVFFAPDSCLGIKSQSAAVVFRKGNSNGAVYTIQDPLHLTESIKLSVEKLPGKITLPDDVVKVEQSGKGAAEIEVSSTNGRIYRFGNGEYGKIAKGELRKELNLASFNKFKVEVQNDAKNTIFTLHLPDEAIKDGYLFSVHHSKSQRYHDFTEADVIDRPSPNVLRYRWNRTNSKGPPVFSDYWKIKSGQLKYYFVTQLIEETGTFTLPDFNK